MCICPRLVYNEFMQEKHTTNLTNRRPNVTNKMFYAEIVGWYGAIAIILAYALVSFGAITPTSPTYQLLNLTGATGVIIISYAKNVKQSVILNIFWACIAIFALIGILFR